MENTKTSNQMVSMSVQNRDVITPQVIQYVERYQMFARKTAESIIGLAKTLIEAEQQLDGVDFAIFCDEVGIKTGDSTYSKLRKIGSNATRFTPYLGNLPNAFSTLYELAKLEPDQFAQIAPDLTPFSTAKNVSEAVGIKKNTKSKQAVDLMISFGEMGSVTKKEVYDAIIELKHQFKFSVKEGSAFIDEMKSVKQLKKVA